VVMQSGIRVVRSDSSTEICGRLVRTVGSDDARTDEGK